MSALGIIIFAGMVFVVLLGITLASRPRAGRRDNDPADGGGAAGLTTGIVRAGGWDSRGRSGRHHGGHRIGHHRSGRHNPGHHNFGHHTSSHHSGDHHSSGHDFGGGGGGGGHH